MMEAVRTSETSVYYDTTQRNIPEDSNLQTRRCEKLKSHMDWILLAHDRGQWLTLC
jgi:hypothetical protein